MSSKKETAEQAKARLEREVFIDFRKRARLPEATAVNSQRPTAADILYVFGEGEERPFELAEICSEDLARDLVELGRHPCRRPVQRWPADPTEQIYRQKIGKTYLAGTVDLLLYIDGRSIMPDDVVKEKLEGLVKKLGKGPFDRIWYSSSTVCCEIGG